MAAAAVVAVMSAGGPLSATDDTATGALLPGHRRRLRGDRGEGKETMSSFTESPQYWGWREDHRSGVLQVGRSEISVVP